MAVGAPSELGAALGVTTQSALAWMVDALELAHRLPLTWRRVEALEIAPWKARQVAKWTTPLPMEGAILVDSHLAPRLHKIGLPTFDRTVTAAIAIQRPDQLKEREGKGRMGTGSSASDRPPST